MSVYFGKFRAYLRKNPTAKGLLIIGIIILGAIAVWGGVRLALSTQYPILVVSSSSMCQRTNPLLHTSACTLAVGDLIVIRGVSPDTISNGTIIIFRPYIDRPDYLVVHRVVKVFPASGSTPVSFWTEGDANGVQDQWDTPTFWQGYSNTTGVPGNLVEGAYQFTVPIPYLGSTILAIRDFMYNSNTGQVNPQGILVIVALVVALFSFEIIEPGKKPSAKDADMPRTPSPQPST